MILFKLIIILLLIYSSICKLPKKIIGGENAEVGEFKFMVSIRYNNIHICGGTIIEKNYILTAAHCVRINNTEINNNIKILSGTIDSINENTGVIHEVSLIIYHSKFDLHKSNTNDIAIIKLKRPIIFNSYEKPINLPSKNDVHHLDKLTVAGWGLTSHPSNYYHPRYLQKLTMTIVDNNLCQINHTKKIYDDHICVIGDDEQGLCIYDSGGPLILDNKIIGIISWGRPCALHGVPDVGVSCWYHLSWINNVLKKFSNNY